MTDHEPTDAALVDDLIAHASDILGNHEGIHRSPEDVEKASDALLARLAALRAERDAMLRGIAWALGYDVPGVADFGQVMEAAEADGLARWWWRPQLREISGVTHDAMMALTPAPEPTRD